MEFSGLLPDLGPDLRRWPPRIALISGARIEIAAYKTSDDHDQGPANSY